VSADLPPVVRRQLLPVGAGLALGPMEPLPFGVVQGRTRFLEPFVLESRHDAVSLDTPHGRHFSSLSLTSLEQWLTTRSCTSFIPCL
jgi:hypothetical protein